MKMNAKVTQNKRLERAKQQYENLLINASEIGVVEDFNKPPSQSLSSAAHSNTFLPSASFANSATILSNKSSQYPLRNPSNLVANTQRLLSSTAPSTKQASSPFESGDFDFYRSSRGAKLNYLKMLVRY